MIELFGHRGAAGEAPENTMAGYRYAWDLGVRCLELDVHLTRDGQLAVIHDETLDRTTDGKGHVGGYTMEELGSFDARGDFAESFPEARIPSLAQVLREYHERMRLFQVEIKTDRPFILDMVCRQVADLLGEFGLRGKAIVTSFDPYALRAVRRIDPAISLGFISMRYTEKDLALALDLGCYNTCIPLRTGGSAELVRKARDRGLEVTGWLGNTQADVDCLLAWGVTSITTNYPSVVLPLLQSRGEVALP